MTLFDEGQAACHEDRALSLGTSISSGLTFADNPSMKRLAELRKLEERRPEERERKWLFLKRKEDTFMTLREWILERERERGGRRGSGNLDEDLNIPKALAFKVGA